MDDSAAAYESHWSKYLQNRDQSSVGARVTEQWSRTLPEGAATLELACGGGYPVTRVLQKTGLSIYAIDSSPSLLTRFRERFPLVPVQCSKVQDSDFFNRTFDACIATGLLFLLSESDQEQLIDRVSAALVLSGRFLFTAPVETGCWTDLNTDIECKSLGQEKYESLLQRCGFVVLSFFSDSGGNNYYDTRLIDKT